MADPHGDREVESRITQLLQGGDAARNQAFELIHLHFCRALCGAARRYSREIDLENLWGRTLAWFNSHSQSIAYDSKRSPIPLLRQFMVYRAIEERRRRNREDRLLQELGRRLAGTRTGAWWQSLTPLERQEILAAMERYIDDLPDRQRQVWRVFVRRFPETERMARLRELVEEDQGEPITLATVERALQEGRRKIRDFFARRGYSEA